MEFYIVAMEMLAVAVPVVVGFIAHKTGFLGEKIDGALSQLVINVALPCLLIGAASSNDQLPSLAQTLELLGYSTLAYAIALVPALAVPRLMGVRGGLAGAYGFAVMFGNVGFIGYPVLSAIIGSQAVVYAAIANIPNSVLAFSLGAVMVAGHAGGLRDAIRATLNPTFFASLGLLALVLLGINDLGFLGEGLSMVGGLTTPAALLVSGSTLAKYAPVEMLKNWRAYVTAAFRLVGVPLLVLTLVGPLIGGDAMVRDVIIIGQGMPVASNGLLYCVSYGVDDRPMLQSTFITIVLSVLTIPVVATLTMG